MKNYGADRMKTSVKIAMASIIAVIAAALIISVFFSGNKKDADYEKALALYGKGDTEGAYEYFSSLYGYKDSAEYAEKIFANTKIASVRFVEAGDILTFGRYEQDNDEKNGAEEIEWIVLEKRGESALVLSRYALDSMAFDPPGGGNDWEQSSVRRWLNRSFLLFSFDPCEQARIEETVLYENGEPYKEADCIFLLSVEDVNKYMKENADRACEATKYAIAMGAHTDESHLYDRYNHEIEAPPRCHWWLRTPGKTEGTVISIYSSGKINSDGNQPDDDYRSVRPAMWIDLRMPE